MTVSEIYDELINRDSTSALLNSFIELKNKAKSENNAEFYYLSVIKISDIYLDLHEIDKSLQTLLDEVNKINPIIFRDIYVSMLERLIYIYSERGSYKLAYKYTFEKRKFIDENDLDSLNRWNLEMAYVYTKLGELTSAVDSYKTIINSDTSDEFKSLALSNIARIYVDQNLLLDAMDALNECIKYTHDEDGIKYCKYIEAKICLLEHKNNEAYNIFDSLFRVPEIESDMVGIANEYLSILLNNKDFSKAKKLCEKMEFGIVSSQDLFVKKSFYNNKIKLLANINEINEINNLLNDIDTIQKEIDNRNKENEDDTYADQMDNDVSKSLSSILSKIKKVNEISYRRDGNIRDFLISYLSKLESIIGFYHFYIVDMRNENNYSNLETSSFKTYDYVSKRLYERSISGKNLEGTVLEEVIKNNNTVYFNTSNGSFGLRNFINGDEYTINDAVSHIIAYPIMVNDSVDFIITMTSKAFDFSNYDNQVVCENAISRFSEAFLNMIRMDKDAINRTIVSLLEKNNLTLVHSGAFVTLNKKYAELLGFTCETEYTLDTTEYAKLTDSKFYSKEFKNNLLSMDVEYKVKTIDGFVDVIEHSTLIRNNDVEIYYSIIEPKYGEESVAPEIKAFNPSDYDKNKEYTIITFKSYFDFRQVNYLVSNNYGVTPYNVDDIKYLVICEGREANLEALENIAFPNNIVSKVNYPREISNFSNAVRYCLFLNDNKEKKVSNKSYLKFIDTCNVQSIVKANLDSGRLVYHPLNIDGKLCYLDIPGLVDPINARDNLNNADIIKYDNVLISHIDELGIEYYYMFVNSVSLKELAKVKYDLLNLNIIVDSYSGNMINLLTNVADKGVGIYLKYSLLSYIDFNHFNSLNIKGILVTEEEDIEKAIKLCNKYDLYLFTKFNIDYPRLITIKE